MAWYDDPLGALQKGWNYVTGGGLYSDYIADSLVENYAESAYNKVSGFLGLDDGIAAPGYRPPSFNTTVDYADTARLAQIQGLNATDLGRRLDSYGYNLGIPVQEAQSWLGQAWDTTTGYVKEAQEWYGAYKESPAGQFVDAVVGYGAGKGAPDMKGIPVRTVSAPGVAGAGTFRSTAVDLRAGYADPRISNAMQKALSSEVPTIRMAIDTINPNRRGTGATISLTSASVKAPKIRKIKSTSKTKAS